MWSRKAKAISTFLLYIRVFSTAMLIQVSNPSVRVQNAVRRSTAIHFYPRSNNFCQEEIEKRPRGIRRHHHNLGSNIIRNTGKTLQSRVDAVNVISGEMVVFGDIFLFHARAYPRSWGAVLALKSLPRVPVKVLMS